MLFEHKNNTTDIYNGSMLPSTIAERGNFPELKKPEDYTIIGFRKNKNFYGPTETNFLFLYSINQKAR